MHLPTALKMVMVFLSIGCSGLGETSQQEQYLESIEKSLRTGCPPGSTFDRLVGSCQIGKISRAPTIVSHNLNIGYISGAPDGVSVNHILTANGKFPAQQIRAKKGDRLQVRVENNILDSDNETAGTTIHWHGLILQNGLGIFDGPKGVTQCAIAPKQSMVYDIPLQQSGTHWWHSHVGTQYTEGLLGPLIIEDDNDPHRGMYDNDTLVFTLGDWYHTPAKQLLDGYANGGPLPQPNSALINGRGMFPCGTTSLPCTQRAPEVYNVAPGTRHRIRIINVSTFWSFKFSIEGHNLLVIEVDGVVTRPVDAANITLAPAQRYSIVVTMNKASPSREFKIHGENANNRTEPGTSTYAVLRYLSDFEGPTTANASTPLDERMLIPLNPLEVAPIRVDRQIFLSVDQVTINGTRYLSFNGNPNREPEGPPVLYRMIHNQTIPDEVRPLPIMNGEVIEVELYNPNRGSHPFHLHGYTFWVMANGAADSGRTRSNYESPIRRDTVSVMGNATVFFRFLANNPGTWLFHCHINWHHIIGLAAVFVQGAGEVSSRRLAFPNWAEDVCIKSRRLPFTSASQGLRIANDSFDASTLTTG